MKNPGEDFTQEGQEDLSRIDLGALAASIRQYNDEHNWGTLLARSVLAAQPVEDADEEDANDSRWSLDDLRRMYALEISKTGISLEPVGGPFEIKSLAEMFSVEKEQEKKEQEQPTMMRMNLENGKKFIAYLQSLGVEQLSDSQKRGLGEVAESLKLQLEEQYDLENPEDERMLELFGALGQIIAECSRISVAAPAINELRELLDVARGRYLKEFLTAKREKLLDEVGGPNFGPSKWQDDETPEGYEARWLRVVDIVKEIRRNSRASSFCEKVIDNLRRSLDYAEQDLERISHNSLDRKSRMKETILKYRSQLADL